MMTTVLRKHTKQYHHKNRFARYLQYFRDVGPSHIVTNCTLDFANWTLGFARAFGENSKLVGGKLVFCAVFKVLRSCRSCFRGGWGEWGGVGGGVGGGWGGVGQSATTFELGEGEDDYLLHGSESYATNHREQRTFSSTASSSS